MPDLTLTTMHASCFYLAVPVKLFANFRKVRALTKDAACISEALKDSKELVLSEDGKRVSVLGTLALLCQ